MSPGTDESLRDAPQRPVRVSGLTRGWYAPGRLPNVPVSDVREQLQARSGRHTERSDPRGGGHRFVHVGGRRLNSFGADKVEPSNIQQLVMRPTFLGVRVAEKDEAATVNGLLFQVPSAEVMHRIDTRELGAYYDKVSL